MSGVASKIAKERARAAGLGTIKNPVKYAGQDYEKLKAEHLASGTLFEDPKFPADHSSLGVKKLGPDSEKVKGLEWKRPSEIKRNPMFIAGGEEIEDVRQGRIGDCWLLSSIACLTMNKDSLHRVIPQDQSFEKGKYAGIFHFMLWQYGEWVDVVVDDLLPTKKNKLFSAKSSTSNEFWSALLEKAYAKICGSYEALVAGYIVEALEDFTGGVGEVYLSESAPKDLYQTLQRALGENCLVGCTSVSVEEGREILSNMNIVSSHIYSVTRAEEVTTNDGNKVQLIRLRNPWGHKEWTGAWSDNSAEWDNVDPEVRAKLNIQADDGEVWMAFPDFLKQYERLEMCDVNLSEVCCGDNYRWHLTEFNGSWKKGSTAGGDEYSDTFWMNPQFRITVTSPDGDTNKKCPVVVSLTQKGRRKLKSKGQNNLLIGFYIYKVNPSDKIPLGMEFFKKNQPAARLDTFNGYRDESERFDLLPGDYVIVPATYNASEEADFYLRVFTEKPAGAHDKESGVQANVYQPILTPETDSEFEIVKDELQKGEFDDDEVKNLLIKMMVKYPEIKCDGFSRETVRHLIKLMDTDHTGTLSTEEFKKTWLKVKNYMNIFQSVDTENKGTITAPEYRKALIKAGFHLSDKIVSSIVDRTHDQHSWDFNGFLSSTASLETVFNMFHSLDPDQSGAINLSLSDWLRTALA